MARRKRDERGSKDKKEKDADEGQRGFLGGFREEVTEAILAVVFLLAAIFLFLSPFGRAGAVGDASFRILDSLFGVGYYLAPALLIALGVSFLKSLSRNLAIPKVIGGAVSFIAGLVLIEMLFDGHGGAVGNLLARGATSAFGVEFGAVAMVGLLVVGLIVVFDAPLSLPAFFRRKAEEEPLPAAADLK